VRVEEVECHGRLMAVAAVGEDLEKVIANSAFGVGVPVGTNNVRAELGAGLGKGVGKGLEDSHHLLAGEVAQVIVVAEDAGVGDLALNEKLRHFEESLVSAVS